MKEMSNEEIQTLLMSGTLTGKISTVRKDRRPHVVPIWFILDKDDSNLKVVFTTWSGLIESQTHVERSASKSMCR